MRFAYADPPYPGMAHHYPEKQEVDHVDLLARLSEFDGWALSTGSRNLRDILPLCPEDVRVAAWCKPNGTATNAYPAYLWEPVVFRGGRWRRGLIRDYLYCGRVHDGFWGSKPPAFCRWVVDLLGYVDGDEMVDLFPGTGVMGRVLAQGQLLLDGEHL